MDFFAYLQIGAIFLFLATVISQTVRLRVGRVGDPIAVRIRGKGLLGIMEVALLALVNLWIAVILLYVLPLQDRPLEWLFEVQIIAWQPVRVVGAALVLVAFCIFLLSLRALGDSWRLGVDSQNPGPLVTRGVYAHSRNPIYLFFGLYFFGTLLMNGTLIFLIFALLAIANLHYQVLEEEKFLARAHGSTYDEYRARVGRYVSLRRNWPAGPAST